MQPYLHVVDHLILEALEVLFLDGTPIEDLHHYQELAIPVQDGLAVEYEDASHLDRLYSILLELVDDDRVVYLAPVVVLVGDIAPQNPQKFAK